MRRSDFLPAGAEAVRVGALGSKEGRSLFVPDAALFDTALSVGGPFESPADTSGDALLVVFVFVEDDFDFDAGSNSSFSRRSSPPDFRILESFGINYCNVHFSKTSSSCHDNVQRKIVYLPL